MPFANLHDTAQHDWGRDLFSKLSIFFNVNLAGCVSLCKSSCQVHIIWEIVCRNDLMNLMRELHSNKEVPVETEINSEFIIVI